MYPSEETSLAEAKAWLRAKMEKGARCPCCSRFAKIYRRRVHAGLAARLILISRINETKTWVDVNEMYFAKGSVNDLLYLAFAGLLEKNSTKPEGRKSSGLWRVTDRGRDFIAGRAKVSKYMLVYDGQLLESSEEQVSIFETLGAKFNYDELMAMNVEVSEDALPI